MKRYVIAILVSMCLCVVLMSACASNKILRKPEDSTLEFWVAEKVSREDFKGHSIVAGVFGGYAYYGKDYHPDETTEDNSYIIYTVTAYPDYSSNKGKFDTVTNIKITDPNVSIYGINCNSSPDEFNNVFKELGCTIQNNGSLYIATYGKTRIAFADVDAGGYLIISVEVTNKYGIIF